jgi:hypothetical protein
MAFCHNDLPWVCLISPTVNGNNGKNKGKRRSGIDTCLTLQQPRFTSSI